MTGSIAARVGSGKEIKTPSSLREVTPTAIDPVTRFLLNKQMKGDRQIKNEKLANHLITKSKVIRKKLELNIKFDLQLAINATLVVEHATLVTRSEALESQRDYGRGCVAIREILSVYNEILIDDMKEMDRFREDTALKKIFAKYTLFRLIPYL